MGSLILKHSPNAPMPGLDTPCPREKLAAGAITFWSFRIMVGMGCLMFGLGLLSLWCRWRGTLFESRLLARLCGSDGTGRLHCRASRAGSPQRPDAKPFTVYNLLRDR